ncbi:MAG: SRPBCC family protein [Salibacteraceae bacterium]
MKYVCSCVINAPVQKVTELFLDDSNFSKWQDGFQSLEIISGEKWQVGTRSKIILQQGKMRIELEETILENNLPNMIMGRYEHKHMTNTQKSCFIATVDNKTEYISEVEYTQFNGVIPKLLSMLFPGKFKAQSQKWMNQFKKLAEE